MRRQGVLEPETPEKQAAFRLCLSCAAAKLCDAGHRSDARPSGAAVFFLQGTRIPMFMGMVLSLSKCTFNQTFQQKLEITIILIVLEAVSVKTEQLKIKPRT